MEQNIEFILAALIQDRASYGLKVQPALSDNELAEFRERVKQNLDYALPDSYAEIIHQVDGIDSNGITIYASKQYYQNNKFIIQGFVEANLLLRGYAPNNNFIYFAESGMDLYRHNLQSNVFEICTRIGLRVMEEFTSFTALLEHILNDMVDTADEEDEEDVSA